MCDVIDCITKKCNKKITNTMDCLCYIGATIQLLENELRKNQNPNWYVLKEINKKTNKTLLALGNILVCDVVDCNADDNIDCIVKCMAKECNKKIINTMDCLYYIRATIQLLENELRRDQNSNWHVLKEMNKKTNKILLILECVCKTVEEIKYKECVNGKVNNQNTNSQNTKEKEKECPAFDEL